MYYIYITGKKFILMVKICLLIEITRMTTFIKAKLKKSVAQSNIDKYRVAANVTKYHIISKLMFRRIIVP